MRLTARILPSSNRSQFGAAVPKALDGSRCVGQAALPETLLTRNDPAFPPATLMIPILHSPRCHTPRFTCVVAVLCLFFVSARTASAENWPGWRGPRGDGTSAETELPREWDGASGRNIAWKAPLSGSGHSSPIVWRDRVFLTSCDEENEDRILTCYDARTGEQLWARTVLHAPLEHKHGLNSYASGTPATDGELVYVTFLEPDFGSQTEVTPGNMVVAAYDFDGNERWKVKPGRFASTHGYCSSPVLFEETLIVNGDHDGNGYIVALDRKSGETVWKVDRPNKTRSYVTPLIRTFDGRTQMLLSGTKCVTSLDPRDGSTQWIIDGPTEQFVASLVDNGRLVLLTAGYPERHVLAIRPEGRGNVTDTNIVWRTTRNCAYVPAPIVLGDYLFLASDEGIATCFEAETGRVAWTARMGNHFSASPIAANGLVYYFPDNGEVKVVRPGEKLDIVATNALGQSCFASPAVSGGRIYVRGERDLFCIGPKFDAPSKGTGP